MLKDHTYQYYNELGYNCAESIIRAGNDYYDLGLHDQDMIMVAGFGAGLQCGQTCGAVLSAVSILSVKYVERNAHASADIHPVTVKLIRKFKERYGSVLCKDIKPQSYKPEYRCQRTVETACDILEETLQEYERDAADENSDK